MSEGVVMKILGRKTRSIFERYNIKSEDDLREAAETIAASKQGQVGREVGDEQGQVGLKSSRSRTRRRSHRVRSLS